jgi:hypothetical protein
MYIPKHFAQPKTEVMHELDGVIKGLQERGKGPDTALAALVSAHLE